jgi:hypothetical protein
VIVLHGIEAVKATSRVCKLSVSLGREMQGSMILTSVNGVYELDTIAGNAFDRNIDISAEMV